MKIRNCITPLLVSLITACLYSSATALTIEELIDRKSVPETETRDKKPEEKTSPEGAIREPEGRDKERGNDKDKETIDLDFGKDSKDPRLACLLSVVMPGSGHLYLRKDIKGISFCMLTGAGYSTAAYFIYDAAAGSAATGDFVSRFTIPGVFLFVSTAIHIVTVVEAHADAEEHNKRLIIYGRDGHGKVYRARIIIEK